MNRSSLTPDESGDVTTRVTPALFGRDVVVRFFPDLDGDGSVSDRMLAAADDVGRLGPEQRPALASMLLAHAEFYFEDIDYGEPALPGEDGAETNRRAFGVRTPDEALSAAGHPEAHVSGEDDGLSGRFAVLVFYPPWEIEHGCGVVLRDGEPVGWGEASVYVGDLDKGDS